MEAVKVSKKYKVVIPEKLHEEAGIHAGDRMVAILKNGFCYTFQSDPCVNPRA